MTDERASRLTPHIVEAYRRMVADSVEIDTGDHVWEGSTAKLIADMGVNARYYSDIIKTLERAGCIVRVQRGGGTAKKTQYVLAQPPPDDIVPIRVEGEERVTSSDQRIADILRMLGGVDVPSAIAELVRLVDEQRARIDDVEGRLRGIEHEHEPAALHMARGGPAASAREPGPSGEAG